jgi:hypothetical protein
VTAGSDALPATLADAVVEVLSTDAEALVGGDARRC